MAEVVATMVVGPLLKIVMEKASGYLLDKYKVLKGMKEQHEILKRKLPAILDIITDAEQAAAHREGAATWLEAIKKVAYQASEVFDEFKYEALRRKAKKEGHYNDLGFSVVKLFPTHNRFVFRNRMGRKLRKVVRAIEVLVAEMNDFGFKHQQQSPVFNLWRQTGHDIFDPKEIIRKSRAEDNKEIVDTLVGQANNADLTVVPIVGMGGLGKTTLARLVYNEAKIQKHFDLLLWVCVSDCFDVDSLAKSIVEAASGKKNLVSGQRYLLVLDDVWTREVHKWEKLKACLEHGGNGSVVLTTTRDEGVANVMGTIEAYKIMTLEDKFIKEIIETRAFSYLHENEERPEKLVKIIDEIVKKCAGSPLAATALGSVLHSKPSEEEWKAVSSRSSICTEETGILPILKLSYNDLPSHMKQCFTFCAIFPKDYEIDVDKLIQLWIAHGFVIGKRQVRLETIGKQIFNELASRSFFQDVKQVQATYLSDCYSRTTCKIHDLMHDVALSVMETECAFSSEEPGKIESVVATEEPSQSELLLNTARHLFLSCKQLERKLVNNYLENSSPAIQTLLCEGDMGSSLQHLSKYSSLQALQLCTYGRSFLLKPKHLHHLRYLDLSGSSMEAFPEDMSILYNLQTLNLSDCRRLCELPRHMKYMTALRHLYTHGCLELKGMPRDLRKLTSLQTLTCFVAGSDSYCCNVAELGHLNLGGRLELTHLENVTEEDVKAVNLLKKNELKKLTLRWTRRDKYSLEASCTDDARVLEKFKPHDGLRALRIDCYRATTFPTWMTMLLNIVEIHLFSCENLQWLFSRDCDTSFTFPKLKELTLQDLVCLERWWEIANGGMQVEEIMFPLLEKLPISNCEKLTALPGQPIFPNLQNACIERCPELTTTAKSPKLSELNIGGCEGELFLWVARHMTSLTNLKLDSTIFSTKATSVAAAHGLREVLDSKEKLNDHDISLEVLVLNCFMSGVAEMCACFVYLQDLTIRNCRLVHWPEKEFQGLVSLRKLLIHQCNSLTGYAQAPAESSRSSETSQLLPRLESLKIEYCESLLEVFDVPASLRRMDICSCRKLESLYGRRLLQGQSASSIHQGSSSISEVSLSSPGAGMEHLEELMLTGCDDLTGVLYLPPSLKVLQIFNCGGLTSVESYSGELLSLEHLSLTKCSTLSSLPDGPQAYSSLQSLYIFDCHGIETLPTSLQQWLESSPRENMYAPDYYGVCSDTPRPTLLKPKTWKYAIRRD